MIALACFYGGFLIGLALMACAAAGKDADDEAQQRERLRTAEMLSYAEGYDHGRELGYACALGNRQAARRAAALN